MSLKFGTSGVRGLVTEMTDQECWRYTRAFADYLKTKNLGGAVCLAGDLRSSTPRITRAVAQALGDGGFLVENCGAIPTPAVTCWAMHQRRPSIMVTGSHIPDDRNGIKFNLPWGEVLKEDEAELSRRYERRRRQVSAEESALFDDRGMFRPRAGRELGSVRDEAAAFFRERYRSFFGPDCLAGAKVVVYQHSAVGRDLLVETLRDLGAQVATVGRSQNFVAVDTEAVENPRGLAAWVAEYQAFALVSTDGDSDRPLLVDEKGQVVRGDVLGILVADFLKAEAVATPVSCNSAVELSGKFARVLRTRIGSPYVIYAMLEAVDGGLAPVVGYEANGGFLTGSEIHRQERALTPLPTRDATLPLICALRAAIEKGKKVSDLVAALPKRFTHSGLLRRFSQETGQALVKELKDGGRERAAAWFAAAFGEPEKLDFTDGGRITFAGGEVVHLRPSGNAPEFRCYTEADSPERAAAINETALDIVKSRAP